ncbi:MAG TPA: hypothetical protein VE090_03210 [Methylomirabilota bacterium]|nr:hypothetical protein [Methylomirabilota bacterium]
MSYEHQKLGLNPEELSKNLAEKGYYVLPSGTNARVRLVLEGATPDAPRILTDHKRVTLQEPWEVNLGNPDDIFLKPAKENNVVLRLIDITPGEFPQFREEDYADIPPEERPRGVTPEQAIGGIFLNAHRINLPDSVADRILAVDLIVPLSKI